MAHTSALESSDLILNRRRSQVFVEIPPSPLFKARVASASSKVDVITAFHRPESRKENSVPLSTKISTNNVPSDKKRKAKGQASTPDTKRAKIPKLSNETTLVACHQCRTKKQPNLLLQCTGISKTTTNRCKASYCDTCLKNRYGRELQSFHQNNSPVSRTGNVSITYHFICPRCEGNCNCAPCRKKKGLGPVGKFSLAQDGRSVREILENDPQALGILPKTTAPMPQTVMTGQPLKTADASGERKLPLDDSGKRMYPKEVPEPFWVPVPLTATKQEVEDRIYLREFILRFNPILNIGQRNLEELDDFTSLHDPSTKAILLALLDLIAVEDETRKKTIQAYIKTIRSLGLNWTKIVPVLYDLRNSMPDGHALSRLPDIARTDVEVSRNTRGMRMQGLYANQLLPILLYLIEVAGDGASIRQELDEGIKQAKEVRAAYNKAMREETERWTAERAEVLGEKPGDEKNEKTKVNTEIWKIKLRKARSEHNAHVKDIQNSHRPEVDCCALRFTSLGCDNNGRTYYALSASGPQRGKKERLPNEAELSAMKKWGWFIAVFGRPGTHVQRGTEGDMENHEDEDEHADETAEQWWGFADITEMRKLSKWLVYCAEVDAAHNEDKNPNGSSTAATATSSTLVSRLSSPSDTSAVSHPENRSLSPVSDLSESESGKDDDNEIDIDSPDQKPRKTYVSRSITSTRMKALAKAILDFAEFVDWRLKHSSSDAKRKDVIAVDKFYG